MTPLSDEPDELLDLVDAADTVIGTITREESIGLKNNHKGFIRGVGVFLVNRHGQVWVPVRSLHKKIWPGGLDFSAAEHVQSGETYFKAAVRGVYEELGVGADPHKFLHLGKVPPMPGCPYFHEAYLYPYEDTPPYNKDDFSGYRWLTRQQLIGLIESGQPSKEVLLPSVRLLRHQLKKSGDIT